jgi:hypothetical protein
VLRRSGFQPWADAVEKRFLGNLCATLIQNEGQKVQVRFKKSTPMIRLFHSSRMAPTFSTASAISGLMQCSKIDK